MPGITRVTAHHVATAPRARLAATLRRPTPAAAGRPRPPLPPRATRRIAAPIPRAVADEANATTAGEDAAAFDLAAQSPAKWAFFAVELAVVMTILWFVSRKE